MAATSTSIRQTTLSTAKSELRYIVEDKVLATVILERLPGQQPANRHFIAISFDGEVVYRRWGSDGGYAGDISFQLSTGKRSVHRKLFSVDLEESNRKEIIEVLKTLVRKARNAASFISDETNKTVGGIDGGTSA